MKNLLRLLTILRTAGKYRLYETLPRKSRRKVRIALFVFSVFAKREPNSAVRLRQALEELGPIFIKFGQILSTRPDLLPPSLIEELVKLQDRVKPFDNDQFKAIVEASLNQNIEEVFNNYQHEVLASASIAQVHAAELKDGQRVVIKVVRPDIEAIIEKDTRLLRMIAEWIEKYLPEGKRLRPVEVVDDYRDTIFDELDLVREGANAAQLKRNFENSDMLYIPKVYWEYTSRNVLVLERIKGIPINEVERIRAQGTDMKLLAARGVEIFFTQVFDHNFFHADMHPGNVFVAEKNPRSPSYIGIDTAIVGSLNREDQYYLARNMLAMFRRDYRLVAELHITSGWVPSHVSVSAFESAIRSVCEPIFQKPLKDISFGEALISLFRTAQRFEMPVQPQLVLLQKTLLNIEGLGRQLYPELDLWETAHPFLEKWLKKRYSPINLAQELQYQAPEWLEKIPQLPSLLINALQNAPSTNTTYFASKHGFDERRHKRSVRNRRRRIVLVCAMASVFSALLLPPQLTVSNTALAVVFLCVAGLGLLR